MARKATLNASRIGREEAANITVWLNGNRLALPLAPRTRNSTTLVPMRALFTALGAEVIWDGASHTVFATKGRGIVKVQIGSYRAWIHGVPYTLRRPAAPPPGADKVVVKRIIDGGTIALEDGRNVRLIGVDIPDTLAPGTSVERYGPQASEFITSQLTGTTIYLEYDLQKQDLYGRTLAYVWLEDGQLFNEILVREGYAQSTAIPPNVRYADRLQTLQADAREGQRGLWKSETP